MGLGCYIEKEKIKTTLLSLSPEKNFANFSLGFSHVEKSHLNKIRIDSAKAYNNFGKLHNLSKETKEFIKSLSKNNDEQQSASIANLITKLVNEVLLGFEKETAWITIRASVATDAWDIPRWHSDGYYYSPYSGEQYKVALTLKGPSSLFYPLPSQLRDEFNSLQQNPDNREKIAGMLDAGKNVSVGFGVGTIFLVGADCAAVHSEPPTHEERLFLSVVPGDCIEIEELYNNWYPKK